MGKKILIISKAEGFIIKGFESKLKNIGLEYTYSAPGLKDLKNNCSNVELITIFTDEDVENYADSLIFIKDFCADNDKRVIIVGTQNEYVFVKKYISSRLIYKFLSRPLNMEDLISDIEKFMEEETAQARRKSILIGDDDVSYMTMISDWLKDYYRVSLVNSGMQAITWLAKNHVDLILLDYEMPVTSGPQVLEMIKSEAETSTIPVMFLTGKGDKESIMKVLSLKPAGYLLKTIQRKELLGNLMKFFASESVKNL